ncbi:MAG: phenylalanine-4-hydroxylase [Saprospiraceae bacterium]|jgi:phenylalanine-4-hydroxylase
MHTSSRTFDPTVDDHNWQILFETHFQDLQSLNAISTLWISGLSKLGIDQSKRPLAKDLTASINQYTGYTFVQTSQNIILEQIDWYRMIADYKMPTTSFVRTPEELEYCDEPDIWHDIMGHIPFLAERTYSDMYQLLAKTYIAAYTSDRQDLLRELDFIGGMLIELGLIREVSGVKAFGSTFYSSSEVFEAFKPENQIEFTKAALQSGESYDRHSFQGKYYIFDSIEQLNSIIHDIAGRLLPQRG